MEEQNRENISKEKENNNNNYYYYYENDEKILNYLDSVDSYLTLIDSLSSTLSQGWLEIASARHSMGATRISSSSFDLNYHDATTLLRVDLDDAASEKPKFALCKWRSFNKQSSHEDTKHDDVEILQGKSVNSQLRLRGASEIQEKDQKSNEPTLTVEDQIQRERSKSLSMFGTLVSPKLRVSLLSFETALDILVEIANTRSAIVSGYNEAREVVESNRNGQTKHL